MNQLLIGNRNLLIRSRKEKKEIEHLSDKKGNAIYNHSGLLLKVYFSHIPFLFVFVYENIRVVSPLIRW